MAIEKMIDEDERERIAAMTDEELDAELRAAGIDPAGIKTPSFEEIRARMDRRAAERAEAAQKNGNGVGTGKKDA
jgi:hypothetical protein